MPPERRGEHHRSKDQVSPVNFSFFLRLCPCSGHAAPEVIREATYQHALTHLLILQHPRAQEGFCGFGPVLHTRHEI